MAVHISVGPHDHENDDKRAAVDSGSTFYRKVSIDEHNIVSNGKDILYFMYIYTIGSAQSPS